ncbi:unnamed protein product, partial [Meganyctiphanes norvegica]
MGLSPTVKELLVIKGCSLGQLKIIGQPKATNIHFWPGVIKNDFRRESLTKLTRLSQQLSSVILGVNHEIDINFLLKIKYDLKSGNILNPDGGSHQGCLDLRSTSTLDFFIVKKIMPKKGGKNDFPEKYTPLKAANIHRGVIVKSAYWRCLDIHIIDLMDWPDMTFMNQIVYGEMPFMNQIVYGEMPFMNQIVYGEMPFMNQIVYGEMPFMAMEKCLLCFHAVPLVLENVHSFDLVRKEDYDHLFMIYSIALGYFNFSSLGVISQMDSKILILLNIFGLLTHHHAVQGNSTELCSPNHGSQTSWVEPGGQASLMDKKVDVPMKIARMKIAEFLIYESAYNCPVSFSTRVKKADSECASNVPYTVDRYTNMLILKHSKEAVRASVCHTATVIANAFMHTGTTSDQFLRDNLDWLSRATNWAKMTATASLGVIHRGHEKEALSLMQAYLPKESNSPGYAESGSLYALGLIHANHGGNIIEYLLNQTKDATSDIIRHGGCLGLGLAAMGTQRTDVYEQLKYSLFQDDAVTGEAAGLAMGLVMLGSANEQAVSDMVNYARDTQHEKILRGLAQGIALTMYGQQDNADKLITELSEDKDAILRRAAMYTVAMAYCGTASTPAMKRLLHVAVSDVDNDVRRAAVEALGFLLFRSPDQIPSMVSLLSESYNPHVRYGAAMALGVACAGLGSKEALGLLEPLTNDPVNFVRQGALIASALVLIQHTESTCPKVKEFRTLYAKVIADKHEDSIAKFGAILAQGIIDAGGRNMTISLQSRTGHTSMTSVVGMFIFTQFWYWFPLAHFLSLAFTPTALIALTSELKMPKLQITSKAKPSTYGYPAPLEEKKKEVAEKVTAVLSITAKNKKKEDERKKKEKEEKMDVDKQKEEEEREKKEKEEKEKKEKEKEEEKKKKEEEKKKEEPNFDTLNNPARVMKPQLKVIHMTEGSRYQPVKDLLCGGIILMKDTKPEDSEELVQPVTALGPKTEEENEPEPPEPFKYVDED